MFEYNAYVGLDAHKETIAVAVALPGREEPVYRRGEIRNQRSSLRRLVGKLSSHGEVLSFCYEAGSCGYGVYREFVATGHDCMVVAPSLVPRKAGGRVKTDRRDALNLARLHCAGELRAVFHDGVNHYNTVRPHSSLGYRPPAPKAILPVPQMLNYPENAPMQARRKPTGQTLSQHLDHLNQAGQAIRECRRCARPAAAGVSADGQGGAGK